MEFYNKELLIMKKKMSICIIMFLFLFLAVSTTALAANNGNWKKDSKGIWYDTGNSVSYKSTWKTIEGKRYYFNKSGYVVTGWKKIKNNWYYFNKKGVMARKKWIKSGKNKYYVGANGKRAVNKWIGNKYVGKTGKYIIGYRDDTRNSKTKTGWVGHGSTWRYYKKGKLVTGWQKIKGKKYYFKRSGYMKTGWHKAGSDYYFLDTRPATIGIMYKGWLKINGNYYYFFPSGKMARKVTLEAGGKKYHFNSKGVCTNFD